MCRKQVFFIFANYSRSKQNKKIKKSKLYKVLNIVKCSRNLEFEKRTDQNFVAQNLRHGKEYCISKKKKLSKQCQKEVVYEYILAFARWWSIFWEVVDTSGYILAGGGLWWIYFDWWWMVGMVVGGSGWWWVVVSGGGYILVGGGWCWMVVGGSVWWWIYFGWWWVVVY